MFIWKLRQLVHADVSMHTWITEVSERAFLGDIAVSCHLHMRKLSRSTLVQCIQVHTCTVYPGPHLYSVQQKKLDVDAKEVKLAAGVYVVKTTCPLNFTHRRQSESGTRHKQLGFLCNQLSLMLRYLPC